MKTTQRALTGLSLTLLLLLAGCNWQMFESVEVRGEPTYRVPGGTVLFELSEFLDEFEDDLKGDDEDDAEIEIIERAPYTIEAKFEIGDDLESLIDEDDEFGSGAYPLVIDGVGRSFTFPIPRDFFDLGDDLPDGLDFTDIPLIIELSGTLKSGGEIESEGYHLSPMPDGTKIDVKLRIEVDDNGNDRIYENEKPLEIGNTTPDLFEEKNQVSLNLVDLFNTPPVDDDDVDLSISFSKENSDNEDIFIFDDDYLTANAYIRIPFTFNASKNVQLLGFDDDDDFYQFEDDLFDRVDADDLEDELANFRSVTLGLDEVKNTTGFDDLQFRMTFGDNGPDAGKEIARGDLREGEDTDISISEDTFEKMRKPANFPLTPRMYLTLPRTLDDNDQSIRDAYELNYYGELATRVTLEVEANIKQRFELGGNDE